MGFFVTVSLSCFDSLYIYPIAIIFISMKQIVEYSFELLDMPQPIRGFSWKLILSLS